MSHGMGRWHSMHLLGSAVLGRCMSAMMLTRSSMLWLSSWDLDTECAAGAAGGVSQQGAMCAVFNPVRWHGHWQLLGAHPVFMVLGLVRAWQSCWSASRRRIGDHL